jgi:hypothetical protein
MAYACGSARFTIGEKSARARPTTGAIAQPDFPHRESANPNKALWIAAIF